jgi:1,4-dihydroxy-2-naphthoyl-CoA synthase
LLSKEYAVLSNPVLRLSRSHFLFFLATQAQDDSSVKAIVITGSNGFFMGGADIPSIQQLQKKGDKTTATAFVKAGQDFFDKIEASSKPVVAAVNGPALGGGLELAMACHARVSLPKCQFGLPELKLGIIPGEFFCSLVPSLLFVVHSSCFFFVFLPQDLEELKDCLVWLVLRLPST